MGSGCGCANCADCAGFKPPSRSRYARRMQALRGLSGLPLSTADFSQQIQDQLSKQSASVQATIAANTGIDTSDARVQQGAQSAGQLIQNGYNPDNKDDNAKLIHAIAGGAALVPGVGPLLAGYVEGLWLVGNLIACPVTNAFASIGLGSRCDAPPCKSSGNWTASSILSGQSPRLPKMPKGSFAALVVPALATYAAQSMNCKGGMPPGSIVDAVAAIWNETHKGPVTPYLIPPLGVMAGGGAPMIIITWGQVNNSNTGNKDPYAYYGFGPVLAILRDRAVGTDQPVKPGPWMPFPVAPPPPGLSYEPPRIINLNTGPFVPLPAPAAPKPRKVIPLTLGVKASSPTSTKATPPKPAASSTSTATKVVVGGALVAGGLAAAHVAYGGQLTAASIGKALRSLLR